MKKNLTIWIFIALLAAFGAACNDSDDKQDGDGNGELKPLVLPTNPRVEKITDLSAVLIWDGSSSEYEVEWNGEILPTKSISYGLEGLTPEQTYSWKVRSKEGERYSEWVNGTDFTTLKLVDETAGWPGNWQGTDFKLSLTLLGTEVPITAFLPEDILKQTIDVEVTKKAGEIDKILFKCPRINEILPELPESVEGTVQGERMSILNNLSDTLIADLDYPLTMDKLPEELAEIVNKLIEEIPLIGDLIGEMQVNAVGIVMNSLNLTGLLKENSEKGQEMKIDFAISGKFYLNVDNAIVNTLLKLLPLNVSLDAGMTLYPKL